MASIHAAAKYGEIEEIKKLIAENPEAVNEQDSDGWTPLHEAALENQIEGS